MIFNKDCYTDILKYELESRLEKNSRYSLRAFARDIDISASSLSVVLNGKRHISKRKGQVIAFNLGYNQDQREFFNALVSLKTATDSKEINEATNTIGNLRNSYLNQYNDLELEYFEVISDPIYFKILEMTHLKKSLRSISDLAKKLEMDEITLCSYVSKLEKLKFLRYENGRYIDCFEFLGVGGDKSSDAIKHFHKSLIEEAKKSITEQEMDEREISSTILAIEKDKLEEAKKDLLNFRREFSQKYGAGENKDSVYCLSMQFFNTIN